MHRVSTIVRTCSLFLALLGICSPSLAHEGEDHGEGSSLPVVTYYVGIDSRTTIPSGLYATLPNPNAGRLTMLVAHEHAPLSDSHFHSIGIYSYTGTRPAQTILPTSTGNRLPEASYAEPTIPLTPGHGLYAGKFVNGPGTNLYANSTIRSAQTLADDAADSFGYYVFHSGADRWTGSLAGVLPALELISLTPGLHVGDDHDPDVIASPGDRYLLGDGNTFEATPLFWVDASVSPDAVLSATFRLVDTAGVVPGSGEFTYYVQRAVPEPSTIALLATAGAYFVFGLVRQNRRSRTNAISSRASA